jgi:hypothetical protein
MDRERILITVKTYPQLSRKYGETVCTAGLRPDGTWMRIYPVPFRRLDEKEQYRKFDWIECGFVRNSSDPRPESFCPVDMKAMLPVGHLGTGDHWRQRRDLVLRRARVYTKLDELISGAKANTLSLAVFKPSRILGFAWEEAEEREWNQTRVEEMRQRANQGELFSEDEWRKTFDLVRKLPYKFSYRFEDEAGRESTLQILDWEAGMLYWNCVRGCQGDESVALRQMKARYFDDFVRKDLHFFMGTILEWHFRAPNPWVIVGVFPVPHERQMGLEFGV